MSSHELIPLVMTIKTLPKPLLATTLLLMLLSLSPSSCAYAETTAPQLYVKKGNTFVRLVGRFAVVPLKTASEQVSREGRRKECIAACLQQSGGLLRNRRSLGFLMDAEPLEEVPLEEGSDCVIRTTHIKEHYGQCHIAGGMHPYCFSDVRNDEAPIIDFFSRDCMRALSLAKRANGSAKPEKTRASDNSRVSADVERLSELPAAASRRPNYSLLTSTSEAFLNVTTTHANTTDGEEISNVVRHSTEQT